MVRYFYVTLFTGDTADELPAPEKNDVPPHTCSGKGRGRSRKTGMTDGECLVLSLCKTFVVMY